MICGNDLASKLNGFLFAFVVEQGVIIRIVMAGKEDEVIVPVLASVAALWRLEQGL